VTDRAEWEKTAVIAEHILETCLYVDDLGRAEPFYRDVLGLTLVSRQEGRHVFFRCGGRMLLLFNPLGSRDSADQIPPHGALGPGHVAFGVREAELSAWSQWLARHNVAIEKVIDWPGGGRSLYFRDPAGNSLELATPRIWGIDERTLTRE
jgi:catechol 2,3-dioxygenase-like lactoylglutathione lyase family enzyme